MIVWYANKRWALSDRATITPDSLCTLTSVDDTVAQIKVVPCHKVEFSEPEPGYFDRVGRL